MSNRALIISPTGCPIMEHEDYEKGKHWRMAHSERTYDTCLVVFKDDFEPEPGTYDMLLKAKGIKWHIIPKVAKMINWEDYDYIGCWDDDYATDIRSVNRALEIARQFDFRLFQQATTSYQWFDCLKHNPEWMFAETNYIEPGVCFFRNDIFRKVLKFLDDYKFEKSEWGVDRVLCTYLGQTAHVVHETTVRHMRPEVSSFDKNEAEREMGYLINDFFPKYMKKNFNIDLVPPDYAYQTRTLRAFVNAKND